MLGLLLLQVLASCLWLGHSEVVTSFASCPNFFYDGTTPNDVLNPENPAWICQCYNDAYRYATLYNKDKKISVYSAYIYNPWPDKTHQTWFVEPQLIGKNNLKEMETEWYHIEKHKFTLDQINASQAVNADYNNLTGLERGHLNLNCHQGSRDNKTATFTLTNIVPQDTNLSKGQWNNYECKTMSINTQGCTTTYVITGAVPGNSFVSGGRVNRPSHIWSAACCLLDKNKTRAWGVIAENDKNKVQNLPLGQLEARLTSLYGGRAVTLFNSACP
ncbi:ENDD1 protein, partial [Bombycilla garrulus]|nr:ENDD1 protein [Bombycilla garrulus]